MVRGLCLRPVSGRSHGLIYDYRGLLREPLCDMFGCQCVCPNMLICDELLCAMAITWLACLCVIAGSLIYMLNVNVNICLYDILT